MWMRGFPGAPVDSSTLPDPYAPPDGTFNITGNLTASGTVTGGALAIGGTGRIMYTADDPSTGDGLVASAGAIALRANSNATEVWVKDGADDTDWSQLSTSGGASTENANTWAGAQVVAPSTIVPVSGELDADLTESNTIAATTAGALLVNAPTGAVEGGTYVFAITLGGAHAVTFDAWFSWFDDVTAPDTSAGAEGDLLVVSGIYIGGVYHCSWHYKTAA